MAQGKKRKRATGDGEPSKKFAKNDLADKGRASEAARAALGKQILDDAMEHLCPLLGTISQGALRTACRRYADVHTDAALQLCDYENGAAKKLLKAARQDASLKAIGGDYFSFSQVDTQLEYWHEDNLSGGGSGGWEEKLIATAKKNGGEDEWHKRVTYFLIGNRTATYYGYHHGGEQGPHTIARILGVRSRLWRMDFLLGKSGSAKFLAFGCTDKPSLDGVHLMFEPYLALPAIKDVPVVVVNKVFEEKNYNVDVKMFKPSTFAAQNLFKANCLSKPPQYSPQLHAQYSHRFFCQHYEHARKRGDLVSMVLLGQILADLHPLSTVTTKFKAGHSETKGGGEGASIEKLQEAVKLSNRDEIGAVIKGDTSKNKGLVDAGSVTKWDKNWIHAFTKYRGDVLTTILANYGLSDADCKAALKVFT